MKGLVLLTLIGCAVTFPQRPGRPNRRPQGGKVSKEDKNTIIRCMAENFGDEQKIQDCRKCFNADIDLETAAGLDEAKSCAVLYWPVGVAACQNEMIAMEAGNMETLMKVVECFDKTLETGNNERCLTAAQATDLQGKMTDASVCIIDSWKYTIGYVKNATRRFRGGKSQGGRGRPGRLSQSARGGLGMKRMMMKLKVTAHCEAASAEDTTKLEACQKCFSDATPARNVTKGRRGRGGRPGRGRREAAPEVIAALISCSKENLSPMYDQCNALMEGTQADMKAAHKCYNKVLVGTYVADCITENAITTADADSLGTVVDCGINNALEWLSEENPRVAEKVGKFLEKMGAKEEDDEEEVFETAELA